MGFHMEEVYKMHAKSAEFLIFVMLEGVYEWDCQSIRGAAVAAGVCLS